MDIPQVKKDFLQSVEEHELIVIRNDDINRHLRFKKPDTICYCFDIITWAGHLCITGDCGTYVFQRIEDMFNFFSNENNELKINTGYWYEKVLAQDRSSGCLKYSENKFKDEIKEWFDSCTEDSTEERKDCIWEEIEAQVLIQSENHFTAINAAMEFEHDGFTFSDFWEVSLEEYTFRYIWNLYAIVWGIQKFNKEITNVSNT